MELKEKVALITGAAGGIGKSISKKFAEQGATVFLNDINSKKLEETQSELESSYENIFAYACDITKKEDVIELFDFIYSKSENLDILVNNAGVTRDSFLHRMEYKDFDQVIKVNLYGTFNCTRAAIGKMRDNNFGRVINISSVVGISGNIGQTNYSASKAAIIGLTKSLALESALKGITVNAVAPGFIDTEMTSKIPEKVLKKIKEKIPAGRMGVVDDISEMVSYLASDRASYITGQVISVNGGYLT